MDLQRCLLTGLAVWSLTACQSTPPQTPSAPMKIKIKQKWDLQQGARVGDQKVVSGLGDIAIDLEGKPVYAPLPGTTNLDPSGCVLLDNTQTEFSFRFCGVNNPTLGRVQAGQQIGTADLLVFATFIKEKDGSWAYVKSSRSMAENSIRALSEPKPLKSP